MTIKEILTETLELVKEVAWEQATRDCSGINWGKYFVDRAQKLLGQVKDLPEPPNEQP